MAYSSINGTFIQKSQIHPKVADSSVLLKIPGAPLSKRLMCHFWMNVPFMDEYAIFGCSAIYGGMCHLWMNVPFMDEYAIYE